MTTPELAERAHICMETIYNLQRGRIAEPRMNTIRKLARVFKMESFQLHYEHCTWARDRPSELTAVAYLRKLDEKLRLDNRERGLDGP